MSTNETILVTGGTGKTGHRVAQRLQDRGRGEVEAERASWRFRRATWASRSSTPTTSPTSRSRR